MSGGSNLSADILFAEPIMESPHTGVTSRPSNHLEPLAVTPRQACILLGVGNTRLYQLISNGELESYLDGRARRITMRGIRRRIARLLAITDGNAVSIQTAPRRRGRPRKTEAPAPLNAT
jgi:excisionase family DNA binding protein